MNDTLSALGFGPGLRPVAELARMLGVQSSVLTPSSLARGTRLSRALLIAGAMLRGEALGVAGSLDGRALAMAARIVAGLDADGEYSLSELARHMALWGMGTADDWLVRLHQAGAAERFEVGGWSEVRRWARAIVMEGK